MPTIAAIWTAIDVYAKRSPRIYRHISMIRPRYQNDRDNRPANRPRRSQYHCRERHHMQCIGFSQVENDDLPANGQKRDYYDRTYLDNALTTFSYYQK